MFWGTIFAHRVKVASWVGWHDTVTVWEVKP